VITVTDTSARSILGVAAAVELDERRIKLALLALARRQNDPRVLDSPRDPLLAMAETAAKRHAGQMISRRCAGPRRVTVRADRPRHADSFETDRGTRRQEKCSMSTRGCHGSEGGAA